MYQETTQCKKYKYNVSIYITTWEITSTFLWCNDIRLFLVDWSIFDNRPIYRCSTRLCNATSRFCILFHVQHVYENRCTPYDIYYYSRTWHFGNKFSLNISRAFDYVDIYQRRAIFVYCSFHTELGFVLFSLRRQIFLKFSHS